MLTSFDVHALNKRSALLNSQSELTIMSLPFRFIMGIIVMLHDNLFSLKRNQKKKRKKKKKKKKEKRKKKSTRAPLLGN